VVTSCFSALTGFLLLAPKCSGVILESFSLGNRGVLEVHRADNYFTLLWTKEKWRKMVKSMG